ncbi:Ig-like domain repeat protein [Clostridium sp. AM34-11AC]|uniref:YDG domain-containing protein n=1 Tax=Clostridium sp. AM34-11AC TaxID=2305242 RepID=UPI0015F32DE5|nr:Ig-like domain repeat protein [Clostridium sp. AM34-11AC]
MRYKKKKRQIVSAALAAVMAMQLCVPSATFAAVPAKKLKVITGFTELPEEVAHIQIPADAGENFEDYLNFPETIEASVVEYKNVDHQKNNADRDKGAEDEKAAADDRDKKEDLEIATGSNAKKENLNEEETPETENSENVPDSNDEEKADKQEVQEKDQQGTFLIATDSNAGDFLEDYEFEDEEISEDIPVLTDISVTWEPDENREDESGFYYYLPVLPREYILAAGVELPEIEVSMDGGIALLASTGTYDIANGGISINSNTLEQYNDATITGSSTTHVILVNGVEATITISDLDIQIPIDNNATTASNWIPAIRLANGANLNLILKGKNTLKGGDMCAAIDVPEGCTLTIRGEGSLKATGGVGAGIGASSMRKGSLGTIEINGGNIEAYGSGMAAGIGGGLEGGIGTIVINGGTVYAKGGYGSYPKDIKNVYGGAGIGGGPFGCVDRIEINGGNVTACGGYVTNAKRHPGAAIGTGGGGAKPIGEGKYKYGDIVINGGTVSAIAYNNEVYAIGVAVKPGQALPEGSTLEGSISISNEATVNLNGGDYFPKSENPGLKNYAIQGTIADVRFTESTYPVTISVGGITWNAGTMKVSDYQGTLKASNYLKPLTPGTPVTVTVTVGDYVYQMEADVADVDDKNATITLKAATPLYETRLKFVSTVITSDQILQATDITVKQNGEPLSNQEGQSAAMVIPSMQISYDEANTGHLTVYLPENKNKTEISVTVPGLNDGNPITKSGETISTTPNEIEMFHDDTVCSHEYYNADGFCEACGAYQEAKNWKGYYEIYNAGQLFWFAKQVNDSNIPNNSNLKLMKDIEIPGGHDWTSIRDKSNTWSFEGTIEGNYHVISGLRPANDGTSSNYGLVASIKYGNVQNIGLVFEGDWTCGLCRLTVGDIKIQNCFVVGTNFSYSCSQGAVTKNGTVTNCLAVSGKLEGTKYSNDHRATFTNCYETEKSDYSSPGITTISEEKLKSGEIAYKLNGDRSDGTWGQVIGTEDYPHFRKYSKTVYYDPATGTYSNNNAASITSAAVTDIKTISDTKATATLKATGTPGAEVKFFLTSGEDEQTLTLDDMFSKGTLLTESSSGNYEYTITDLAPDTEHHVRLMIKKDGVLSLDVTYVNFQTEKVRQEAPNAADVSINYEQETLENKASCDLEYAASKDAQSWTTIRQGGKVRLTGLLDNIRENGGSVPFYIRRKASSSMSASEAVLVADLQTQAIPEESNKPNIDYRKEEITISSSLQYVIVNGTNTSPNWTSAKMGSGSGISITDIISSDHESTVYYRYAASNTDKKFAGKPESITILKRTAAPAAITEGEVTITGTTITINRTNPENDIEYGYRDVDSDGAFTWIDGTKIQGLYPAHGYQVTSRIKAKENAFASERTEPLHVSTKDTLRIVGNGTPKWDAKGTYGVSLAQIPVSLASGYGVYNGANQLVAGTWSWEPENSSSASGIYPNVKGNKAYTVKFTPTDSSVSYDRTLTDSVVPDISKYPLNFSVAVEDKTYDGTTTAIVQQPLMIDTGVNTAAGNEKLQITGLTAAFNNANAGSDKEVVIDASKAVITGAAASGGGATADPDNYQVNIPSSATATIKKAASSITINDAEWPGTKTYGDPDFPLTGVTTVGDGAVTKTSDSANVLTVDADGRATIHGAGTATVTISVASGTNYTAGNNSRPITVQKGTISLNLKAGKKTDLMQRLLAVLGNVEDTYVLTLEAKGAYQDALAGTVIFYENGQQLNQTPIPLTNGTASMEYSVPSAGTHEISAEYMLPADGPEKENYNDPAQVSCSFEVEKADEDQIQIKEVDGKLYGDDPFELELTGQKGTGAVKFSVPADNGVLELSEVNGKTEAKIIGAGTVLVTAEVAGDTGYNGTTVTREITIGKAQTPEVSVAAPKIAPVPADAPEEVKEIANLLEEKTPEITGLDTVAADLIRETENGDVIVKTGEDQTISGVEAKEKLQKEGVNTAGKKVRLVVEPYMSVEVKGVTEKQGVNVITFEITALYNVKATTAGKNETMQEKGNGKNTVLIGSAIPQKVGIPVTITLPLPADYPTEDLFIRHLLHNGRIVYYPVTVRVKQGSAMAEFVNKDGFSTFELLSDSRKGTVAFDHGVGERSYSLEQMDEALPTVSKDGVVFKGWKINGTLYTTVNEALLDVLDQAEGHRVTAQAVLESSSPETPDNPKEDNKPGSATPDNPKGDRNTGSGSDREDTDWNVTRNAWETKKVNGVVRWSYYDSDGRRVFNVWKQLLYEGTMFWYHFGADGYMDTGWFKDADGNWYYLNQASDGTQGTMKTGWFKDTDGNWYYLNPVSDGTQGAMKTGWFTDPQDGHLYYLDPKTGAMVTGNIQNDSV